MSIAAMLKNRAQCTPKTGVNLVGLDDYEDPGEQLYVIESFKDVASAERAQKKYKQAHPEVVTYLYTAPDAE